MEVTSFVCPECSTTLRIKNRAYVNRSFDCPECHTSLKVTDHSIHTFQIERNNNNTTTSKPLLTHDQKQKPTGVFTDASTSQNGLASVLQSPVAIAWVVAVVMIGIGVVLVFSNRQQASSSAPVVIEFPTQSPVDTDITIPIKTAVITNKKSPARIIQPVIAIIPERQHQQQPVIAQRPQPSIITTEAPVVLKPKPIDIAEKLKQRFLKYDQSQPVIFKQFLFQFEELAGVPIVVGEAILQADPSPLQQTITFQLQAGTLQDLLKVATGKLLLTYRIEPTQIRILPQNSVSQIMHELQK